MCSSDLVAVLARTARQPMIASLVWVEAPLDAAAYARALYAHLRALDEGHSDVMIVEEPPHAIEWAAIRDRLTRAAAGR